MSAIGNTQIDAILNHLQKKGSITQLEATKKYGCLRLGGVIFVLRKQGHQIETERVNVANRYGTTSPIAIYHYKGSDE